MKFSERLAGLEAKHAAATPVGWLYKVIVNKHVTGQPKDGEIQIASVWGLPSEHLYFSPGSGFPDDLGIWWKEPVYLDTTMRNELPNLLAMAKLAGEMRTFLSSINLCTCTNNKLLNGQVCGRCKLSASYDALEGE